MQPAFTTIAQNSKLGGFGRETYPDTGGVNKDDKAGRGGGIPLPAFFVCKFLKKEEKKKKSLARLPQQAFDCFQYILTSCIFYVFFRKNSVRDARQYSVHLCSRQDCVFFTSSFRFSDPYPRTHIADWTGRAMRNRRLANSPAVKDKNMTGMGPLLFWQELTKVLFDLYRISLSGPAQPGRNASDVGIDHHPGDTEGIAE